MPLSLSSHLYITDVLTNITFIFLEIQQLKGKIENSRIEKETLAKESDILIQGSIIE